MSQPLDGLTRRRIYLMRHAEAAYWDENGNRVSDPRLAPLSPKGRDEAEAMRAFLADARFDRVICSGLPRTVHTAETVARGRGLSLDTVADLEEIQAGSWANRLEHGEIDPREAILHAAYGFWDIAHDGKAFAGGETLDGFSARVTRGFKSVLARSDWRELLLVCHGGVNRAILTYLLGGGPQMFPAFEQDSACVNVIDIDHGADPLAPARTLIRGVNITPADAAKHARRQTTLEGLALRLNEMLDNPLNHRG